MKEVEILLPKLGESVADATIIEWLVQPGSKVKKDDILCEVGTDKVETELPSEFDGEIISLLVKAGDVVDVGSCIATILVSEVDQSFIEESSRGHRQVEELQKTIDTTNSQPIELIEKESTAGFLSPVVRKMMAVHNISIDDLQRISGSGVNSRITKQDVNKFLDNRAGKVNTVSFKLELPIKPDDTVQPLSRKRQLLAKNMRESNQLIPHVTTFVEINASHIVTLRKRYKERFADEFNVKLTFTHFMQYAVIQALKNYPELNSWMNEDEWIQKVDIHLGFATALNNGELVVPNIKSVNNMDFVQFVQAMVKKAMDAKSGKLKPDDLMDTTFTVSNTGMFGSVMGTPIITRPQVAVLAFGQIQRKPCVVSFENEEKLAICDVMMVSLSYDHRVIDGSLASKFLMYFKNQLESFILEI